MAALLNCKRGTIPFVHVGLAVGQNMIRVGSWKPVIDAFQKKLAGWKADKLSFGGRLQLAKSVLESVPLYYFSLFKAPLKVLNKLESIRFNFLWGGGLEKRKMHWVKRELIAMPKERGGLGLVPLSIKNLACMAKWVWRYKKEENQLWRRVIRGFHGVENGEELIPCKKGWSGVWASIYKAQRRLEAVGIKLKDCINLDQGEWRCSLEREGDYSNNGVVNLFFKKNTLDGELTAIRWSKLIPSKVNILIWRMVNDKLPTRDNIKRRGVKMMSIICPFCEEVDETVYHLFAGCHLSSTLWSLIANWCKVLIGAILELKDVVVEIPNYKPKKDKDNALDVVFRVVIWSLWKARNERIFNGKRPTVNGILAEIKATSFFWLNCRANGWAFRWEEWCRFSM